MELPSMPSMAATCRRPYWIHLLVGVVILASFTQAGAQSSKPDLMLYPSRVVFERNQRAAQVDFVNTTPELVTYRLHLVNRRMDEWGAFVPAEPPLPGERFADSMLRYSPRQVTMAPGATQTVRLLLRKPAGLEPGEYRSHLLFERLPSVTEAPTEGQDSSKPGKELSIQLTARINVSIPVIVRHGDIRAEVSINGLRLQPPSTGQPALLDFVLARSGERSVYGDLTVHFLAQDGRSWELGGAKGVAVYSPNPLRRARLPLTLPVGLVLGRGQLQVTYSEREENGGHPIAQAAINLP